VYFPVLSLSLSVKWSVVKTRPPPKWSRFVSGRALNFTPIFPLHMMLVVLCSFIVWCEPLWWSFIFSTFMSNWCIWLKQTCINQLHLFVTMHWTKYNKAKIVSKHGNRLPLYGSTCIMIGLDTCRVLNCHLMLQVDLMLILSYAIVDPGCQFLHLRVTKCAVNNNNCCMPCWCFGITVQSYKSAV